MVATGVVILTIAALAGNWTGWPLRGLSIKVNQGDAVAAISAAWAVEATLFALTAAVTALIVNLGSDATDRAETIARYRRNAFDATAAITAVALLATGWSILALLPASSTPVNATGPIARAAMLFLIDVAGIVWLVAYSHRLISTPPLERAQQLVAELSRTFETFAVRGWSRIALEEWGANRGLAMAIGSVAPGPQDVPIDANTTGYLHDISLTRLDDWLQRLEGDLGHGVKARVSLQLNALGQAGTALALVNQADAVRARGVLDAFTFTDREPPRLFQRSLGRLRDSAAAAARDGRLEDFTDSLSLYTTAYVEALRLAQRLLAAGLGAASPITGWPPLAQLRIQLHRLGEEVLTYGSPMIVNRWMYFAQGLLEATRDLPRDAGDFFQVWEQVMARDPLPGRWEVGLRLREYSTLYTAALRASADVDALVARASEAKAFLRSLALCLRWSKPERYSLIRDSVEQLAATVISQWRQVIPANQASPMRDRQRLIALELERLKDQVWFSLAAYIVHMLVAGKILSADANQLWTDYVRPKYPTRNSLWNAWWLFETADPLAMADFNELSVSATRALIIAGSRLAGQEIMVEAVVAGVDLGEVQTAAAFVNGPDGESCRAMIGLPAEVQPAEAIQDLMNAVHQAAGALP